MPLLISRVDGKTQINILNNGNSTKVIQQMPWMKSYDNESFLRYILKNTVNTVWNTIIVCSCLYYYFDGIYTTVRHGFLRKYFVPAFEIGFDICLDSLNEDSSRSKASTYTGQKTEKWGHTSMSRVGIETTTKASRLPGLTPYTIWPLYLSLAKPIC
jgi:hypothetical protein